MKAKIEKKRIDKETSIKPGADWWIVEFEKLRAFLGPSFPPPFSPSFSSSLFPLYERRYRRVCEGAGKKNKNKIKIKFGNPPQAQGPIKTNATTRWGNRVEYRDPAHIRTIIHGMECVCVLPCCIPLYKSTSIFITQVNVRPSFLLVWILLRLFFFQSWLLDGHAGGPFF